MSLHLGGVYGTGADALDINLSDNAIVTTPEGVFVITTTGYGGGLVVYRLQPDGQLLVRDTQLFPGALQNGLSGQVAVAEINGETVIIFGGDSDNAWGYAFSPNGQFGAMRRIDWADVEAEAANGAPGALKALELYGGDNKILAATQIRPDTLGAIQNMSVDAQDCVLSVDCASGQIFSQAVNGTGNLTMVASLGALNGLAIASPTAMEVANFNACSFAVVASATGSSITVIEVAPDGSMQPVHQMIDTASTRFANVQDLTLVQEGDHVFVLAVGSDHGVTVFRLLPDGHLVFVETFSDDRSNLLNTPSSVTAEIVDGTLHVFIGTQNAAHLVHLQSDQDSLGRVASSSADGADLLSGGGRNDILVAGSDRDTLVGGGGDDILSSGPERSTLTGDAGNDIFVIRSESTVVTVTDFEVGRDRLDLSDLPMLRNLDQLQITTTATGAIIRFRDVEVIVTSQNGAPLHRADLFPNGLMGPDSMLIIFGEPDPAPPPPDPRDGVLLTGSTGADSLFGDIGPDTISGERGNDRLYGLGGNDMIDGGMGHDRIWGGAGRDTLRGGDGNDILYGGGGHDRLFGDDGNDTIHGEAGRDLIRGGAGDDLIWGGGGRDRLHGNQGRDIIHGGGGKDRIWGGGGSDRLYGESGNDVIYAHVGHDRLYGGSGNDRLYGNTGNDRVFGGAGNDTLQGNRGNDTLVGGRGDDLLQGGVGFDRLSGGAGNDTLKGGAHNDVLQGGGGHDRLIGGGGDDTLNGGGGADRIIGGPGDDRIIGGRGNDIVRGGGGADTFVFHDGDDRLLVQDFRFSAGDMLELDADLWGGGMDIADVLDAYTTMSGGNIVLDFGNGDIITLANLSNMNRLEDHITIA